MVGMSQWYRSALRGHPLPALTDWNHGAASRHTTAQSATVGLHSVAPGELLLISHPAEGLEMSSKPRFTSR